MVETPSSSREKLALLLPFLGLGLFWVCVTNPFTMKPADWGNFFYFMLVMGPASVVGLVLAFRALPRARSKLVAWLALAFNTLALLWVIFG